MNNPENSHRMDTYLRLLRYLKPLKLPFFISILGFAIFAASQPMLAKFFELVLTAIEAKDASAQLALPAMAVGIFIIRGFGYFLGSYYNEYVGASVVRTLQFEVFQKLTVLPAEYFDHTSQGQVLHRLNSATGQVKKAITDALKILVQEGLTVIFLLGYAFFLNWKMSLIFVLLAPVLGFVVSYTSRRFRKISRKNENALGDVMQASKEMINNYPVVRAYGAQRFETGRFGTALDTAFRTQMKIRRTAAIFSPFTQFIVAVAIAGIVFMLLAPSNLEAYTTPELVGYLMAISLLPKPFRQLSGINVVIQRGIVGADMVFEILDTPAEPDAGTFAPQTIQGDIAIHNLSFTYPKAEQLALKNLNFTIKQGEMIALVGESGSGKSTLASLLNRVYQVPRDTILVDNVDINDYQLDNLRKHISLVDQNIFLFNDTIRHNIAYGDTEYTEAQILEAMRLSHSEDFIMSLPNGLDTLIGDNGVMLSGGQRQRLSIARAFLKNSPVLILDEATSALDNESEKKIKAATEMLAAQRTTIVIAHRLSTIEQADRLFVLDKGEIVETGSHKELMDKNGYYAKLFYADNQSAFSKAPVQ